MNAPPHMASLWTPKEMEIHRRHLDAARRIFDQAPDTWTAPCLVYVQGDRVVMHSLVDGMTVGREAPAAVCLPDPAISREHLRLETLDGLWLASDLDSKNGLWINGSKHRAKILAHGDMIRLGNFDVFFYDGE